MNRYHPRALAGIKKKILAFLFFMLLMPVTSTPAYVLQGVHVLQLTAKALGKARALELRQKIIRFETGPGQQAAVLDETVYVMFPNRIRSDIFSSDFSQTRIIDGDRSITVIDGRKSNISGNVYDHYRSVLTYGSRTQLLKSLASIDIDASISSLGRFEDQIAFVLGAKYPDASRSQAWIEKESFIPLRLLLIEKTIDEFTGDDTVDIVFGHWSKKGNILYPMQIHFFRNGLKEMEILTESVVVDPVISMELMSIEHLESTLQEPFDEDKADETDQEAVTDVQQNIEEFTKKFE